MDAESLRKLKTFNLTTANAIIMNLPRLCIFMRVQIENLLEPEIQPFVVMSTNFLDCTKNRHMCHALPFVASLLKLLYKVHEKPPKMSPK